MVRTPPSSPRTAHLFPSPTLLRSTAGSVPATVYALPNHRPMPAPVISAGIKTLPAVVLLAGLGGLLESIEATEFPAYAMALGASTAIAAGFAATAGDRKSTRLNSSH